MRTIITNVYSMLKLTEGNCWDGIRERGFSNGNYKQMSTLNRSLDGNKASVIYRSTEETPFYCPFMGHKYYETCAKFVIPKRHILALNNEVSQQFKDRGNKQDEYIS